MECRVQKRTAVTFTFHPTKHVPVRTRVTEAAARRGMTLAVQIGRWTSHRIERLARVADGQEALKYVTRTGRYQDPALHPVPGVVLLDVRMPEVDGATSWPT